MNKILVVSDHCINIIVLVITASLASLLTLARGVAGPEGEIVPQQLHDQGTVLVAVLVQGVQLGNSIIKCLQLCKCNR